MKLIKYFLLILLSFNISVKANSNDEIQSLLKEGEKLIFIRHAIAPGGGDPVNFDILKCETQRNLSKEGIAQSKKIGKFFLEIDIKIDKVLSSEWCRCKQTAKYAFNKYETKIFLNSFFSAKFASNKNKQINDLKNFTNLISQIKQKNLIFKIIRHKVKKNAFVQRFFKNFKKD